MRFCSSAAAGVVVALGFRAFGVDASALPQTDASAPPPTDASKDNACCAVLGRQSPSLVSYPDSAPYKASINSYWSLQARQAPYCIVRPLSTADVSQTVQTLVKYNCRFAVRGGGHTPQADSGANIDNGVTIDLGAMKDVRLSRDNLTTSIGPGAHWIDVFSYLDARGYAVPGGRASTVGVAGLTTGGGNSFFSARYGFVCDNVKELEMVLASGEIVKVNGQTRPDLFKAMKGGSNNFGIVTRFDLITFPQGPFWGGVVAYPYSTSDAQIKAFVNFNNGIEKDQFGSLINIRSYSQATGQTAISNAYEYTKAQAYPPSFKELTSIKPETFNSMRITNSSDLTTELSLGNKVDARDLFMTLTFLNDEETIRQVNEIGFKLLEPNKNVKGLVWTLMFQPLPRIITDLGIQRGGNVLGLDRQPKNAVLFLFYAQWDLAQDDAAIYKATTTMIDQINAAVKRLRTQNSFVYLNYAFPTQNPIGSYGPANVKLLQAASKKYDPQGVFQRLVPGGFKISKAGTGY
ncbi:MAG: hypothetical protein M1817_000191 [Caeruleum heppii]|nr:MAG: hypothetical protein M1817_000191 [Caeruleum heppii]